MYSFSIRLQELEEKELRLLFDEVAKLVSESSKTAFTTPSDEDKLLLYGLFKHVVDGPISENFETPSMFDIIAKKKHQARKKCLQYSSVEAMKAYIEIVSSQNDTLAAKCDVLLNRILDKNVENEYSHSQSLRSNHMERTTDNVQDESMLVSIWTMVYGWVASLGILICQYCDIQPLIPRGRLDISYQDLLFAALRCMCWWRNTHKYCRMTTANIRETFGEDHLVVGLSVRSLLDLYLSSKKFHAGSQVILVPPISVPGMMHVFQFHNIEIVSVDLPDDERHWVDVKKVKAAITNKTIAVMVVHPFGIVAASKAQMILLSEITSDANCELWEDCAEVFTGLGADCYRGNALAHVRFFSFGMIKTLTTLAGGIAIFREKKDRKSVEHLLQILPERQSLWNYFRRIVLSMGLNFISDSKWRVGMFVKACTLFGLEFDSVVTRCLRGFQINDNQNSREIEKALIYQIRKQPSSAMLELMLKRFLICKSKLPLSVARRTAQCRKVEALLQKALDSNILKRGNQSLRTYWAFPIICQKRDTVSRVMVSNGFDVVSGASQLCCVDALTKTYSPRTKSLMESILYLPITGQTLEERKLQNLVEAIRMSIDNVKEAKSSAQSIADVHPHLETSKVLTGVSIFFFMFASTSLIEVFSSLCSLIAYFAILGFLIASLLTYALRLLNSDLYLREATGFVEHCDLLNSDTAKQDQTSASTKSRFSDFIGLETLNLKHKKSGQTVILTGATGFIGTMILRDILSERKKLGVTHVILITRTKKNMSASDRIKSLLEDAIFSFLSSDEKVSLVEVLNGDTTLPAAGLSEADLSRVMKDSTISHVFHCAAEVGFTQELPDAASANITSSLHLQALTSRLTNEDALFVHFSTAFVHGGLTGCMEVPLDEELFPLGGFDAMKIYQSMLGTQFYASKAMDQLKFPNSYTLSKCICEHLLVERGLSKTMIIRPSIVGPSLELPFEGWAGVKPSTIVAGACLHLLNKWNLWYLTKHSVAFVPVDVLSRYAIFKAFTNFEDKSNAFELHSCSIRSYERVECDDIYASLQSEDSSCDKKKGSTSNRRSKIFNATWDSTSHVQEFTWMNFSTTYLQLGCIMGYFNRTLAMLTLFISGRLIPLFCRSQRTYVHLHRILVRIPVSNLARIMVYFGLPTRGIKIILPLLDLPLLFFPFMHAKYFFRSDLHAPRNFDSRRYVLGIAVAAHRFVSDKMKRRDYDNFLSVTAPLSRYCIGGKNYGNQTPNMLFVAAQPRGNAMTRLCAFVFMKALRLICLDVTVDIPSFQAAVMALTKNRHDLNHHLVLAPTHRSFFDFILISYMVFMIPELNLDIPFIIAAEDFDKLPLLGWLATKLRAIYIKRGRGTEDPLLRDQLTYIKSELRQNEGASIEFFIEGKRSRDRRFLKPKTGVLKCLHQTTGTHSVLPITINYENLPEQRQLVEEACGIMKHAMNTQGALYWLFAAFLGRVHLGKIHIAASAPLQMKCEQKEDFAKFANKIQREQKEQTLVSNFHIDAVAALLHVDTMVARNGLIKCGCKVWPSSYSTEDKLTMPTDRSELASILLQVGHKLAPLFFEEKPRWARWLDHDVKPLDQFIDKTDPDVIKVYESFKKMLSSADAIVAKAFQYMKRNGFKHPKHHHLLQVSNQLQHDDVPSLFVYASSGFKCEAIEMENKSTFSNAAYTPLKPIHNMKIAVDQESLGFWGHSDSGFVLRLKDRMRFVTMKGKRYVLGGRSMTKILPFIETELGIQLNPLREFPMKCLDFKTIETALGNSDKTFLERTFEVSLNTNERLRHGSGHALDDVFALRSGLSFRIPDAVVWPVSEDQIEKLITAAKVRNWCLIPFGGGTNVSNATRCPKKDVEPRPIISVDMRQLKKIIYLNAEDGIAHVEAGITGADLVEELQRRGWTMGHEPDSIEFSTLGGWIATKSSGMKRNRYGNIEDIVLSVRVYSSKGILWKGMETCEAVPGRISEGIDIKSLIIGSEGSLGIITSAVIRIWPLPQTKKYDSVIFPCFEDGLSFVRSLARKGRHMPASIRLLDNAHFRLGQALQADGNSILEKATSLLMKMVSSSMMGTIDKSSVVCATIGYEGDYVEVANQEKMVKNLASNYGGIRLGSKVGNSGYNLTFMIAYLRDFAMTYHVMGESFETFVPWSKISTLVEATKERIIREHRSRYLPGRAFVGCRVTQLYHEGACLYFYLCCSFDGVENASKVYSELETAARNEILKQGGSLSHHHGIGKHRVAELVDRVSPAFQKTLAEIKHGFDKENIFGARNGSFALCD